MSYLPFYPKLGSDLNIHGRTFYEQGRCQIYGVFISMAIAIIGGIIAGFLIKMVYAFK